MVNNEIKNITFGEWQIKISEEIEFLSTEELGQIEKFINKKWIDCARKSFKPINFSMLKHKIPSPIIRIDVSPHKILCPYEIDVDPMGMGGYLSLTNGLDLLLEKYLYCLKAWGIREIRSQVYPSADIYTKEHELFLKALAQSGITISNNGACAAHIVGGVEDETYESFKENLPKSLTYPLENKRDLIKMQRAYEVQKLFENKTDEEIWEIIQHNFISEGYIGFVAKPINGWGAGRGEKIGFVIFSQDPRYKKYCDSKSRTIRLLREIINQKKEYLIQLFIGPKIKKIGSENGYQIYRIYLVYNPLANKYEYAGGFWNWCPHTMKIHGTSNAIVGPIRQKQIE